MDLTQGYHQAPLTLATRAYTPFITFSGVYQFRRLSFGPKRAPSYFQEIMATVVLTGLIYMCQCSISVPDAGVHVSMRISRLFLRVYVLCAYRRTDFRPLVWNVAVCTCVLFE